jgi:hypothetical protein
MPKQISLVIAADEPALFFSSIEAAEQYLEAVDVEAGVYTAAYGRDGSPYRLNVKEGRVAVVPDPGRPPQPDALKALLHTFLAAAGSAARQNETLSALLDQCAPHLDG